MKLCQKCSEPVHREGAVLCVRHQLIENWNVNTSIDNLGAFDFFRKVIPKAFKNFKYGIPRFHREIVWECLRDNEGWKFYDRQIAIQVFRGASKTTLVSKALALYLALTGKKKYIVIASKTARSAEKNLRWIKGMLSNSLIISIYGDLRPERFRSRDIDAIQTKWTGNFITLSNGVSIEAIGMGQHLRGSAEGEDVARIDMFIADDTESNENTKTPERREDNFDWLFETVLPSLDVDTGTIVFINTLTHTESILASLMKDIPENNWRRINYPVSYKNDAGEEVSNWEEKFTLKIIEAIKNNYKINPNKGLRSFYKEYYNIIQSGSGINPETIQYWNGRIWNEFGHNWIEVVKDGNKSVYPVFTYLGIDGAYSTKPGSDYSALVPIAVDPFGRIYLPEYKRGKYSVFDRVNSDGESFTGFIDEADRLHTKYHFSKIIFGTEGQQGGYFTQLKDRFKGRCVVQEHKNQTNKIDMLYDFLAPRYEANLIFHKANMSEIYRELVSLGETTDDIIDALQMAIRYAKAPKGLEYNPLFGAMEEGDGLDNVRAKESVADLIIRKARILA